MFKYVSGVCGSGKTTAAIKKMEERFRLDETLIYATGTKRLLEQTKQKLESLSVNVDLIVSNDSDGLSVKPVSTKLLDAICDVEQSPRVILCTTKTLIRIASKIPSDVRIPLFIDEDFVVVDYGYYIALTDGEVERVQAKLGLAEGAYKYSDSRDYKLPDGLVLCREYVNNPLYRVVSDISDKKLEWVSHMDIKAFSECFPEVIILAACHEDTLQYHAIESEGINQEELDWCLATEHYTEGSIHLFWVLTDRQWRTNFKIGLNYDVINGESDISDICLAFERTHWSNESLSVKGDEAVGIQLPVKSHGMNNATDNHHFISLHTQMPTPYLNSFLKRHYKMTDADIRKSYYHYICYQGAMRTSLRNSTELKPRTEDNYYCFGDKQTALYFSSKLSKSVNVHLSKLGTHRDLDIKKARKDKVSDNKQEKKNRSADRKHLMECDFPDSEVEGFLIFLRDWRRGNPKRRITKKLYTQLAGEYL